MTVWNPNGITFANISVLGSNTFCIFIDKNNIIYVPTRNIQRILIWENGTINPTEIIYTTSLNAEAIFVTSNRDIYTVDAIPTWQINKWKSNTNNSDAITYLYGECMGIFIDINNNLYFSVRHQHIIMKRSLNNISNILTIIAGTGCSGNTTNTFNEPIGIFLNTNFDLYVADFNNHRIQFIRSGTFDAITVAGAGSQGDTITLNFPTAVILDADNYLFITDYNNNRIVRSGPYGFQCICGCTGSASSASNMFDRPTNIAFDTYGNIYVVDEYNHRIQKFLRLNNTLGKFNFKSILVLIIHLISNFSSFI